MWGKVREHFCRWDVCVIEFDTEHLIQSIVIVGTDLVINKKGDLADPSGVDSQLYASVHSFASYIHSNFTEPGTNTTPPPPEVSTKL